MITISMRAWVTGGRACAEPFFSLETPAFAVCSVNAVSKVEATLSNISVKAEAGVIDR